MKLMFNFLKLLIICVLCISWQPAEVAIPGIFGLISYPVDRLVSAFEDGVEDFHEATIESLEKQQSEATLREINHCRSFYETLPDQLRDVKKIKLALDLRSCLGCVPLGHNFSCDKDNSRLLSQKPYSSYPNLEGNCCTEACEDRCERLCPETFELLGEARERSIAYRENLMDITNSASDFGDPSVFGGYCHGISAVRRSFATLAKFDPKSPVKFSEKNKLNKFEEFYGEIIQEIISGERVRTIPGFKNINHFTSDPRVRPLLQEAVKSSFMEQNFHNPLLVESLAITDRLDESEFMEELSKIELHIQAQGSAQISFGKGGLKGHTIEIYHMLDIQRKGKNYTRMCVIDSNANQVERNSYYEKHTYEKYIRTNKNETYCPSYIEVSHEDWSYSYEGQRYTNSFHVDRFADRMLKRNLVAVKEDCEKQRGCD